MTELVKGVESELHFLFGCVSYKDTYSLLATKMPELEHLLNDIDRFKKLCEMPYTFGTFIGELWNERTQILAQTNSV